MHKYLASNYHSNIKINIDIKYRKIILILIFYHKVIICIICLLFIPGYILFVTFRHSRIFLLKNYRSYRKCFQLYLFKVELCKKINISPLLKFFSTNIKLFHFKSTLIITHIYLFYLIWTLARVQKRVDIN